MESFTTNQDEAMDSQMPNEGSDFSVFFFPNKKGNDRVFSYEDEKEQVKGNMK